MKRYWLFGGDRHYPQGGWDDFIKDFDTIEQCIKHTNKNIDEITPGGIGWYHVIDSSNMKKVLEGEIK